MPLIKKRESFRWTVEHPLQVVNGKPELLKFDMEFRALPRARVNEIMRELATGKLDDEGFIDAVIVGWHDMKRPAEGGGEEKWAFSVEALKELCEEHPGMVSSITNAWTQSIIGAVRKN